LVAAWPQARIDVAVAAIGWRLAEPETARRLTERACAETGFGAPDDSRAQLLRRVHGVLNDLHGVTTLGLFDADPARGLRRYAKPIGVIGVMTPATAPLSAIAVNALNAVKTRNAAIFCPNPGVREAAREAVEVIRAALAEAGAPVDLIQIVDGPDRFAARELAESVDLVMATGGADTVRRVTSAGRPAYAAGPGNAVVVIDETADLARAADAVMAGKTFDNGTSCSSESCLVVETSREAALRAAIAERGAYVCDAAEGLRLRRAVWPDGRLARAVVGRPATKIAALARIRAPKGTRALVAALAEPLENDPLCGEKLSPVLGLIAYSGFDEAVALTRRLTTISGRGHSCGVHTAIPDRVERLAEAVEVSRVMVNQSTGFGNSGDAGNGMPFTTTIACGSWGRGATNENVHWRHFLNYTWVSEPIARPWLGMEELAAPYLATRVATEG
ncbi:aldehyde dehydrogenase family protein, partial [Methylopila musalis]